MGGAGKYVLVAAVMLAAGCGSGRSATTVASLDTFYGQKLSWAACPQRPEEQTAPTGFECARLKVPLDYAHPGGPAIEIALNRLPATDRSRRIGSLLTNPGGPGGSGLDFAYGARHFFTGRLRQRYDIVGMDPRGVGLSSPVLCEIAKDQATDAVAAAKQAAEGCTAKSGKIIPYVGTGSTARDLDIARAALGDQGMHYMGISYGTLLGQYYAELFPQRVGRMVLDSVVDPTVWPGDPTEQALGFENAVTALAVTCVEQGSCPLGGSRTTVMSRFNTLVEKMDKAPLPAAKGEPPVSATELLGLLGQASYSESTWPAVQDALAAAFKGDGSQVRRLTEAMAGADEGDEVSGSWQAVACRHLRPEERTLEDAEEAGREALKVAPNFGGSVLSTRLACTFWPAASLADAGKAIRAKGAAPILLTANTGDAATPVGWARSVRGQLDHAVLATNQSGGHGFYPMGACTHKVVDDYLLDGTLPAKATTCHDRQALSGS